MIEGLLIVFFFVMGAALFSGLEISILGTNPYLIEEKYRLRLQKINQNKEYLVSSMVIGHNFCLVAATIMYGKLISSATNSTTEQVVVIAVQVLVFFFLAEALPKSIFRKSHYKLLKVLSPLIWGIHYLLLPISYLFRIITQLSFKLLPKSNIYEKENFVYLLGTYFRKESKPISKGLLSLGKTMSKEIMTPLPEIYSLNEDSRVDEATKLVGDTYYSRYPVYKGRGDHIIGYINTVDLLKLKLSDRIIGIMEKPFFFPEMVAADKLLFQMQKKKLPIVFLVNEYGSVSGMVTLENIAEEIVGDEILTSEQVKEEPDIIELDNNNYLIDGNMDIDDFNQRFNVLILKEGFETITGFIISELHKIPEKDESLKTEFGKFIIKESDSTTIHSLLFNPIETDARSV